jgi:hypothetical protein
MRQVIRSLLTFLALAACAGIPPAAPVGAQSLPLQIRSTAMPFKIDDPTARKVDHLIWRGGIAMTADSINFGGWSDLVVSPDNHTLTSISDLGAWFTATIERDTEGNLKGLSNGRIGPLHGLDGRPLEDKEWADAEGMALMADGSWLVSFERHHRIWHYPTLDGTPSAIDVPDEFAKQPHNGGIETLTALSDGRIVAISEELRRHAGSVAGWIGEPAGEGRYAWRTFDYSTVPDFHPTAIRRLPDGSFATLERAFSYVRGIRVRVMRFPATALRAGALVTPAELAFLASPYAVDNLEGLAATIGEHGETLLWMISDDNFNPLQRNLLLLFELEK